MGRGRGIIVGRKCPKIQNCPTCGRMRVYHPEGYYKCPVPTEVTAYLIGYAKAHGKAWKSKLVALWASGAMIATELQQARNMIGPTRLYRLKFKD